MAKNISDKMGVFTSMIDNTVKLIDRELKIEVSGVVWEWEKDYWPGYIVFDIEGREKHVEFENGYWVADDDTSSKDLAEIVYFLLGI